MSIEILPEPQNLKMLDFKNRPKEWGAWTHSELLIGLQC